MTLKKTQVMFNSFADRGKDILLKGTSLDNVDNNTYLDQLTIMNSNKERLQ